MGSKDSPATFESDLNPAQLRAVLAPDGPHLVVAGAGTGKTRTLVSRVAHLVDRGVPPEGILLLTFTRRAAQEMLQRASQLLDERCQRVSGGTFHSFANLVLRRYADRLGFENSYTILDRDDAADILGLLRSQLGFDQKGRRFPRKDTILDLLSKRINTRRSIEKLLEESYPQFIDEREALEEIGVAYQEHKRLQNVMDYDDLLVYLLTLLKEHPEARQKLSAAYRHILVDEYQDTNRLQAHIAALLAASHGNLMVVGDDAQSVYSFRGADLRNILDFPKLFEGTTTTLLEQNYRSTQPILDLSNAVLESATERYEKNLFSEIEDDQLPTYARVADDSDQAAYICNRILELREDGIPLSQIAVLSRAAWHTNGLEIELGRRNIPFRKYGGQRFVEAAHVKDLAALLKVSINPLDTMSWFRVLQLLDGVGARRAQQMADLVRDAGADLDRAFATHLHAAKYGATLRQMCTAIREIADDGISVPARIDTAVEWLRDLLPRKYDDAKRRLGDFEALRVVAERYESLEPLLTDIAIDPPSLRRRDGPSDPEDEWINVSTVHSAKGLEWHAVFIVHLASGYFPTWSSFDDPDDYDEERRLLYVAMTRAKRELHLIKPEQIAGRGAFGGGFAETSPLIQDIPRFNQLAQSVTFSSRGTESLASPDRGRVAVNEERLARIEDYFDET